jgi:hypothetical protein
MEQNLKTGGSSDSLTPSTRLLNQRLGTSPELRRLTPFEIELLIRSKQELAEQGFATVTRASTHKLVAAVR